MRAPAGSAVRRRRVLLGTLIVAVFLFFFVPWEIPISFREASLSSLSRASIAKLTKSNKGEVQEIYGLLHLVTGDNEQEHVLSNAVDLNPTMPISLKFYAAGDKSLDWDKERDRIDSEFPVIVFSKVCGILSFKKIYIDLYIIYGYDEDLLPVSYIVCVSCVMMLTGHVDIPSALKVYLLLTTFNLHRRSSR